MQISNILKQPAGMAVPKCINRQPIPCIWAFFTANVPVWGWCRRHG